MLLIAILIIFFTAALINYVKMLHIRHGALRNLPGPICFPLIGAVHVFLQLNPKNLLKGIVSYHDTYGSVIAAWVLNRIAVSSTDLEMTEKILASHQHITKQSNYKMLHQWLGTGLLLSDGKKWYARRKIITPAFHFKILELFVEVFDQQATILLCCLEQKADGCNAFDVYPFICLAALDIIAETAMGTKVGAQTNARTEYVLAVNKLTKIISWRLTRPHLSNEILFSIICPHFKWQQMRCIKILHSFTTNIIEQRRQILENELKIPALDDSNTHGTKQRMALLDLLLQSTIDGQPLTNEDIREEVDTFMFEGHDTSTSALSFILHLIARHSEVQQKILEEISTVACDEPEQPLSLHVLNDLKYIECVIKEALRLYPSVPIVGRQLTEDFKYTHSRFGDGVIPAGTEFLINLHATLRDPKYYAQPNEFLPERHLNGESIGAFQFIPFSAGPRNCIGQKFAMLEMKMVIAKIVRKYELLPLGPAVQPEVNIIMRSTTGFQLGMRKRN